MLRSETKIEEIEQEEGDKENYRSNTHVKNFHLKNSTSSLSKSQQQQKDRPRQVLRQVRHQALDVAVLGRADVPVEVLRPLLRRDAGCPEVGARAVRAELKGRREREREREKSLNLFCCFFFPTLLCFVILLFSPFFSFGRYKSFFFVLNYK